MTDPTAAPIWTIGPSPARRATRADCGSCRQDLQRDDPAPHPPAVHFEGGHRLGNAVAGDFWSKSSGEKPGEQKAGRDRQEDPGMSLVDCERKEELLQPVDEVDECCRPQADANTHEGGYGEESTHLSFGEDANCRETADALQRLRHVTSEYSHPIVSRTHVTEWACAIPISRVATSRAGESMEPVGARALCPRRDRGCLPHAGSGCRATPGRRGRRHGFPVMGAGPRDRPGSPDPRLGAGRRWWGLGAARIREPPSCPSPPC